MKLPADIVIANMGKVKLIDREYIAEGDEATVFIVGNSAVKILPNGVVCNVTENSELELFANNNKVKQIKNSPADLSTKLFNKSESAYFIDGKNIYHLKTRK